MTFSKWWSATYLILRSRVRIYSLVHVELARGSSGNQLKAYNREMWLCSTIKSHESEIDLDLVDS